MVVLTGNVAKNVGKGETMSKLYERMIFIEGVFAGVYGNWLISFIDMFSLIKDSFLYVQLFNYCFFVNIRFLCHRIIYFRSSKRKKTSSFSGFWLANRRT